MKPRVLLTGASGFVGRAVLPLVMDRAAALAVVARKSAPMYEPGVEKIDAHSVNLIDTISHFSPDVIIHLATHFIADHHESDISPLIKSNVELGTQILESAVRSSARVLTISSAWQHFDGEHYSPVSLYAASKQAFDDICVYYRQVKNVDICNVTLFDTYGPADSRRKLIPMLLQSALSGNFLDMSDGNQLIDLTEVSDVALAIVHAALDDGIPEASVVRSWHPLSIREVVRQVEKATNTTINVRWGALPSRGREMRDDWVFGIPLPGWKPKVSLSEGLRKAWMALAA